MTTTAILFLVLSLVLVWGGLVVSVLRLRKDGRGAPQDDDVEPARGDSAP